MREVPLSTGDSVVLYDTSGPYTDSTLRTDIRFGLPRTREAWIAERGDTETYEGRPVQPVDNGLKSARPPEPGQRLRRHRAARGALPGRTVTQLAYARRGDITPEMEFIALREGCTPSTCATRWPAAAPSCRST
jgi:phosphomethylpyrimidine synthase